MALAALIILLMLVLALVAVVGLFALIGNLVGLALTLIVAGVIGILAERITNRVMPGELPYGFVGAILAGILGSWLGTLLLGRIGPVLFGIPTVSTLAGAILVTLIYGLAAGRGPRRSS